MDCLNKLVCLALVCMAMVVAITVKADVDCNRVLPSLEPCLSYVDPRSSSPVPSPDCCHGVKTIFNNTITTPDRQQTCRCLESEARNLPAGMFDPNRAATLPKACGVDFPYNITTNFDCNSINY